jgi:hypothetical protein
MSNVQLGIQVDAQVGGAITGLQKVRDGLAGTSVAADEMTTSANRASDAMGKKLPAGANQANTALTNFSRIVQDAPFGIIGISNNIDPLIGSFQALKAETGSTSGAFKALAGSLLGGGGIALAVSLVTSALTYLSMNGFFKTTEEAKKTEQAIKPVKTSFDELTESINKSTEELGKQSARFTIVADAISQSNIPLQKRNEYIDDFLGKSDVYLGQLGKEKNAYNSVADAIGSTLDSLGKQAYIKGLLPLYEKEITKLVALQKELFEAQSPAGGLFLSEEEAQAEIDRLQKMVDQQKKVVERSLAGYQKLAGGAVNLSEILFGKQETRRQQQEKAVKDYEYDLDKTLQRIDKLTRNKLMEVLSKLNGGRPMTMSFSKIITWRAETMDKEDEEARKYYAAIQKVFGAMPVKPVPLSFSRFASLKLSQEDIDMILAQEEIIGQTINDVIGGIGESLGNAMAGEGGNIFGGIIRTLGRGLVQLGKMFVTSAKLIAKIQAAISSPLGVKLAIPLGIGLIAFGTLLSKVNNQRIPGFAKGVQNFRGGLALVGEEGPELVRLPTGSDVIPNNRIGQIASGGGGMRLAVDDIVIDGYKLRIVLDRANQSYTRNF